MANPAPAPYTGTSPWPSMQWGFAPVLLHRPMLRMPKPW